MERNINFDNWKWVQLNKHELNAVWEQETMLSSWLMSIRKNNNNCVKVHGLKDGERIVKGSLIYRQNVDEEEDHVIFHFYLTSTTLFTVDLEFTSFKQLEPEVILRQLNKTENAVDGFLFLLGELVNDLLVEIDQFEESLHKLIWGVKKRNDRRTLEHVFARRHELLVCKNLLIPIQELRMAIEESDFPTVNSGEIFTRTCKRIDRAMVLLREYGQELDSMIHLEEVISSHRGNEIMKTLTVLTIIFTPIMALGALWGMNFKYMPELEWRYGYLVSIVVIILSTALLYGYIKTKGWTGDLLKGKKKGSFFK
ncbi:magnesium transporter CorA family protein [Neobacillus sp. CF12]|uniref:magnesium transporter CorA family protein n=1 Tax=Neobacillus sp. CF12 TaxID=3055864 RepID=UPI0025A1FFFC|nr:magnesium transporter CorA family protein [Neobacillus sp. CF12]MDM5329736.1 magnesium transporter CorA family protein [Neobacillus sp. CF12]